MALNLPTFYKRTGSAIVFSIVMLGGMLWNVYAFFVLAIAIQVLCLRDYFRLIKKIDKETYRHKWLPVMTQAAGLLLLLLVFMSYNFGGATVAYWPALLCVPMLIILATALSKKNSFMEGLQALGGMLYILLPVSLLLFMRMTSLAIPLALVLMIWVNDTMAYLVGSFIGKRPFSPISPNKTWEGTAGGALLTIGAAALWGHYAPWYHMTDWMALAFCAAVAGTAGDLLESKLKRIAKVKDSGTLMPGHGGALDRFDSLLVAAPFAFVYVYFFMVPVEVVVW
ncbi:MAG: phosphatidate cytidylyltransferase [Flavipsychrobacter sp.]|nr:phosphatidate cytidylyltransferase [Flavipsychrobacter sp.]